MKIESICDFPPYNYTIQILSHCPKAGLTYFQLWSKRNKENKLTVLKKDIPTEFLTSVVRFRNDLMLLVKEAFVNVEETSKAFFLELTDWNEDFFE